MVQEDFSMIRTIRSLCIPAALLLAFSLTGCATSRPGVPTPEAQPRNPAVTSLMEKAHAQSAVGQHGQAGTSLERALRIEPRNPKLWQELARVRLSQGLFLQAENLAAKSNALAGDDLRLRQDNWRIIGQARSRHGDLQGAQDAFAKAEDQP
jgi:cytochrome c-type biogenesis protein CcmH/NrfG